MDDTTSSCTHSRSLRVQFDESISKRQPQQEEEARRVLENRDPCGILTLSNLTQQVRLPGQVSILSMFHGRKPERVASQLNCDVETSRDSVFDKICLMKHREIGGDIV